MDQTIFYSIAVTGFAVAFAHAAIPTHWLPFVLAGRGQKWSKTKTIAVTALCGTGHVLFTTLLGALLIWFGIKASGWLGSLFPWIAGSALIVFGLYYLWRQYKGEGHGHSHFGGGHSHDGHDHGAHDHGAHGDEAKRIDTGHGVLLLEVHEDGVPPRFRVRVEGESMRLPRPASLSIETTRPDNTKQKFTFVDRGGFLESFEDIPEPHAFTASVTLSHGDHGHSYAVTFTEHEHGEVLAAAAPVASTKPGIAKSDGAVIASLFTLLTFSPCEGFLPVYVSAIKYGWAGFLGLSAILASATVVGMVIFTWLTLSGLERLKLEFLESYEAGILGTLILFLGFGIIFLGF